MDVVADSSHRNLHVHLLHGSQQQHQHPAYQSYDSHFQKRPTSKTSNMPSAKSTPTYLSQSAKSPEYIGTSMESLLNAIEVHPALTASSPSRSPSPSSSGSSNCFSPPLISPLSEHGGEDMGADHVDNFASISSASATNNRARMSIRNLLDDAPEDNVRKQQQQKQQQQQQRAQKLKPRTKSTSPTMTVKDLSKRKWSNLSSANFEEDRNAKIRRSIQDHVTAHASQISKMTSANVNNGGTGTSRQVFDSKDPSVRYQMTTICCLHASVAQKSYGSEKRFLCPPPIVNIQAPQDDSNLALSSKPQVTMSVICDTGDSNSSLGQRSTLEDDHTSTFRYLYVTSAAKAKAFQLKLQVYGRTCLPNGFITGSDAEEGVVNTADLPEPYAVFDSAPIAIISKPSKKTAKARNVSSCILAGSLVSLFNRINSQTVRTKYMSVQDNEICAKNSTWSAFSVMIVSNGTGSPVQDGSQKPITYGAEIILKETATGLESDCLIVCKVENGRIQENATGPICQMQKVALMSTKRNEDGQPVYLSAVGNDHQVGRYMDHSTTSKTVLRYQPSSMTGDNKDIMKPGSDDFLCWTIVGIAKFEYTYFESLPAATEGEAPHPITPFPTLMKNPVYNAASHTLELVVSNFYSQIGNQSSQEPMHVWLGSRGPLTTHIIRRNVASGSEGNLDQTTLLVDLPHGKQLGAMLDEKSVSLPLLFVRQSDGITYNSRAKVVFTRPDDSDRWTVSMA
ncbi:hypothetical protein BG011_001350 [Mortierella polycephala]|uniref:Beta-trefoil n=1 Tax=Mortierella polycephala TaxID=41804 RepID=A0A9P6Q5G2_9FUNG|nr:hypothetical protein BG011_001350 [Mortierella polycephala]